MSATRHRIFASRWIYGVFYDGTREELLAAGVVREGEFPGDPGRAKRTYEIDAQRKIHLHRPQRQRSEDRFQVWVTDELALERARADAPLQAFLARCKRLDDPGD